MQSLLDHQKQLPYHLQLIFIIRAEGNIFNFGHVRIDRVDDADSTPHFIVEIRDENGIIRPGSELELVPKE
ncbi:MAG: hypothetical protein ACRD8W_31655 [Nitrososphaeraceae archaeon]